VQSDIINATMLLNDQERITAFLRQAPLIMTVMEQQDIFQASWVLRWLIREYEISDLAVALTIALNVMYIADYDSESQAWRGTQYAHVVLALIQVLSHLLNHTSIDNTINHGADDRSGNIAPKLKHQHHHVLADCFGRAGRWSRQQHDHGSSQADASSQC